MAQSNKEFSSLIKEAKHMGYNGPPPDSVKWVKENFGKMKLTVCDCDYCGGPVEQGTRCQGCGAYKTSNPPPRPPDLSHDPNTVWVRS